MYILRKYHTQVDPESAMNIYDEANLLNQIDHSTIPKMIQQFYFDDTIYLVKDIINGISFKEWLFG